MSSQLPVAGDVEMKRTQELTAIHYRRSVKRPLSPSPQNADLQDRCPVCGTRLAVVFVQSSEDAKGAHAAQKVVSRGVQKRSDED